MYEAHSTKLRFTPRKLLQLISIKFFVNLHVEQQNQLRMISVNGSRSNILDKCVSILDVENSSKRVRHRNIRGQQKAFQKAKTLRWERKWESLMVRLIHALKSCIHFYPVLLAETQLFRYCVKYYMLQKSQTTQQSNVNFYFNFNYFFQPTVSTVFLLQEARYNQYGEVELLIRDFKLNLQKYMRLILYFVHSYF